MSDDFVAPVKGLTKALDTGIKLARRVSKSASSASAAQALQITESAQRLRKSLEGCSQTISGAYRETVGSCGEPFTKALVEDESNARALKELKVDLIEQINECLDFDDEPESFDKSAFNNLLEESQKCAAECLNIFNGIRDKILREKLENFKLETTKDDRAQLSSMKLQSNSQSDQATEVRPVSPVSIKRPSLAVEPPAFEPVKPKSPWTIDSPSQFNIGTPMTSPGTSQQRFSRDISPSSKPDGPSPCLIPKEQVNYRLSANEEFLERRRQSRILWQKEFRQSISSIEENRVSEVFTDIPGGSLIASPILEGPVSPVDAPRSRASSSGYDTLMTRQRSQGQASQQSRGSRTSSILQDRQQRTASQASQESIFGIRASAPLSPPLSEHRTSGQDNWGILATTLQLPGFGEGVEQGLEVVSHVDHDNGLILANERHILNQPTPTASLKSIDHPMRHDSSFYKFGGFCEGAKAIIRGELGFKVVKRPSGHYSSTVSGRCIKCSYEVGWHDVQKDQNLERSGIYGNSGIRWRQKFISKCHVKTNSVDEPLYACIFCVEKHKTVEEHDATVFFSVGSLFRHLAKHAQPVPNINGIKVIYGFQPPEMVDFDIHFTRSEPKPAQYSMAEIASKVATRPAAHAIVTHHPKNTKSASRDPEGNLTLHFAAGARIVGITFPDRFHGQWAIGYHDGERGSFPCSAIQLELPIREDVLMNAQSSLIAYAKWDFKPKESKDGGWVSFKKGERISSVGYTFQDQWCWSGQTSKGKWGLFPQAFVEGLQEGDKLASSPGSVRSGGFGMGLRIGSIPLGRKKTTTRGQGSVSMASGSGSGGGEGNNQPGLEVVASRTGSWRHSGGY